MIANDKLTVKSKTASRAACRPPLMRVAGAEGHGAGAAVASAMHRCKTAAFTCDANKNSFCYFLKNIGAGEHEGHLTVRDNCQLWTPAILEKLKARYLTLRDRRAIEGRESIGRC